MSHDDVAPDDPADALVERYDAAVSPRVYRGYDRGAGVARLARLVLIYGGVFAGLWVLGLVVRGWRGWVLVIAPLALMIAVRVWKWRRVWVEIAEGTLRYEGAAPERDFEVPLSSIAGCYHDRMLGGGPLVLVLEGGDERVLSDLNPSRADDLREHLVASGVEPVGGDLRGDAVPPPRSPRAPRLVVAPRRISIGSSTSAGRRPRR